MHVIWYAMKVTFCKCFNVMDVLNMFMSQKLHVCLWFEKLWKGSCHEIYEKVKKEKKESMMNECMMGFSIWP